MTAAKAGARPLAVARPRRQPAAIVALAWVEARRILLHPVYLIAVGYGVLATGRGFGHITRGGVAELIGTLVVFFLPVVAVFTVSLVATSSRRSGADETLAALPVTVRGRSAALLLAGLAPAVLSGIAAAAVWFLDRGAAEPWLPGMGAALAAIPLLYLGVTCLATAAARWLPWPGVAVAIVFGLVVWVANAHGSSNAAAVLTTPWVARPEPEDAHVIAGYSDVWHFVYLTGLVGLAATAALFRDDLRRLVTIGTAIGLPTVLVAWAQLP
jgi:hypothetical protein